MAYSMCKSKMSLLTQSTNCVENMNNNTWKETSTRRYEIMPLFSQRLRPSQHSGNNINYSVACLLRGSVRHHRDTLNEIPTTIPLQKRLRHYIRNRYKKANVIVPPKSSELKQEETSKSESIYILSRTAEKPANTICYGNVLHLLGNANVTHQTGDDAFQVQKQDIKRSEESEPIDQVSKLPEVSSLTSLLQQITDVLQDCEGNSHTNILKTENSCLNESTPLRVASAMPEVHVVNNHAEEITSVQQRPTYFEANTHDNDHILRNKDRISYIPNDLVCISSNICLTSQTPKVPSLTSLLGDITGILEGTSQKPQQQAVLEDGSTDCCAPFPDRDCDNEDITRGAARLRSDISVSQNLTTREETSSNSPEIKEFNSQSSSYRASIRVSPYNFQAHIYRHIEAKSAGENQESQFKAEKDTESRKVTIPINDTKKQKFLGNDFTSNKSAETKRKGGTILSSHISKSKRHLITDNLRYNIDSQLIKKRKSETVYVKRRNFTLTQPECLTSGHVSTPDVREEMATTRHSRTTNTRTDASDLLQTYSSTKDKLPTNPGSSVISANRSDGGNFIRKEQRRTCRHSVSKRSLESPSVYRWVKGKASQRLNMPQAILKQPVYTEEWLKTSKKSHPSSQFKWVRGQAAHGAEIVQTGTQDSTRQQPHDELVGDYAPKRKVVFTKEH